MNINPPATCGTRLWGGRAQVINPQVLKSSSPQVLKSSRPLMSTGHDWLIEVFDKWSSWWRPDSVVEWIVLVVLAVFRGPQGSLISNSTLHNAKNRLHQNAGSWAFYLLFIAIFGGNNLWIRHAFSIASFAIIAFTKCCFVEGFAPPRIPGFHRTNS